MPIHPIPFITLRGDPKHPNGAGEDGTEGDEHFQFDINPEAVKLLQNIEEPVSVISIAGVYRSGKSFILNQLAGYNDGFNIGSTIEPCTQGIWMWVVEDRIGPEGCKYILLDTEGLGSYIKTETYDVQIFSLALLLGSFFIYNSINNIDEGAIDKLSLVVQLTKHIRAAAEGDDDPQHLKMYFPFFLWLVRDFALDLSINGKKVTAREYLDSALQPMKGDPKKVEGRNKVREFIKQFFAERDCCTLVRPVADEQQLQNLAGLSDSSLRPEYKHQVAELKDFIFEKCVPKKLHGQNLNGPMLLELSQSYVEAINSGAVLTISTAWENVVTQECQKALTSAMKAYESKLAKSVDDKMVYETEELEAIHRECFAAATKVFRTKAVGGKYWKLEDELDKFVEETFTRVKQNNYQRSLIACEQVMRDLALNLDDYFTENKTTVSMEQVELEWGKTYDSYNRTAKGPAKYSVAAKALSRQPLDTARRVHSQVTHTLTDTYENKMSTERTRHDEEYKRMFKLHEDSILIRKNLDVLVSQLTQHNADLNKKIIKSEEDMRVMLNQRLKMQKKMEMIETEHLTFLKHKQDIEEKLKKKGVDMSDIGINMDKCLVM
jgi:hypothetical protein